MVTLLKSLLNSEGSANVTKVGALNSSLYDPSTDLTDMGYPKQVKRRGIFDPSPDLVELVPQSTGDDGCGDGLGCVDDLLTCITLRTSCLNAPAVANLLDSGHPERDIHAGLCV